MFYYRPYVRRSNTVKPAQPAVQYTVETVWAAAAHATRINGGYFKTPVFDPTDLQKILKHSNRDIMKDALANPDRITDEDRATGAQALSFLAQHLTLKALKNRIGDFDVALTKVVNMTGFTSNDRLEIALVASQISAYERAKKELATAERIDHSRGHLADVGVKVQAHVEVTKSVWSQKYNVNFISGITDTNQAVFFSYREKLDPGTWVTIKGTVKAKRPDSTQLSRVKVL